MEKSKKKLIMILLIIVSMITIFFTFKTFRNKPLKELPEVKLKEIKREKSLAIMISTKNGYKEYDNDLWPDDEYYYVKSECVNNSGNIIEEALNYNADTKKATLTTNETIYCTLYFDKYNYMKVPLKNTGKTFGGGEEIIAEYMLPEIKNIYFVNYINLDKAIEHWDIGDISMGTDADSVVAWTETIPNDVSYKNLYIGSKTKIRALSLERAFVGTERDMTKGQIPVKDIYVNSIYFNDWLDTSKTTSMKEMFFCDKYLKNILGMENWDVSNLKITSGMFYYNESLTDLDSLKTWNVENLLYASWMFEFCNSLTHVDLSGWNSPELNIVGIFAHCEKLNNIDMRNLLFDTITYDNIYTFYLVPSSVTIIVKDETQREALRSQNAFPGTIKIPTEI